MNATFEYRRNGVLIKQGTVPPAPAKPVDQMTTAELKAEMERRLPCCGQAPDPAE